MFFQRLRIRTPNNLFKSPKTEIVRQNSISTLDANEDLKLVEEWSIKSSAKDLKKLCEKLKKSLRKSGNRKGDKTGPMGRKKKISLLDTCRDEAMRNEISLWGSAVEESQDQI